MELPRYQKNSKIGEDGITVIKRIVESDLSWIFRPNHQEHDFGIDAYIDVVSEIGHVTGKTIAIQVKTGDSYFKEQNDFGWVFRGQMSHLNYYLNHDIPVLIILVDAKKQKAYWCHCDPNKTELAGENWKITVPESQELNINSKQEFLQFISPVKDYASQLEYFWKMNKTIQGAGILALIVDKPEIESMDCENILTAFERIQINPELIKSKRNKVDIWIHGYNDDPRELFQIDEVINWISKFLENVNGWAYFLSIINGASFLRVAQLCKMRFIEIPNSEYIENGVRRRRVEIDLTSGQEFLDLFFNDLNTFCDVHKIRDEINIEITESVVKYLACEKEE